MGILNKKSDCLRCASYPTGEYSTGCLDLMIGKDKEGIFMRIYYPSAKSRNEDDRSDWTNWYLGHQYSKGLSKHFTAFGLENPVHQLFGNYYTKRAKIPSVWEAPVADGRFPPFIFSHGLAANRSVYSSICNDIASHGFVVAAIEHRDQSACATFTLSEDNKPNWLYLKTLFLYKGEFDLRHKQVKIRARECSRALDVLERLSLGILESNDLPSNFPLNSFQGKIDIAHPILGGHSFGGATTILTLAKDKRFIGGVCLDPWLFPLDAFHRSRNSYSELEINEMKTLSDSVKQPMLFILMEGFQDRENIQALKKYEKETNVFWTVLKAQHLNQTDTTILFKDDWEILKKLVGCASVIHPDTAMRLNNALIINFICKLHGMENTYNEEYRNYIYKNSRWVTEGARGTAKYMLGWNKTFINF